jgi:hypothetical protein
MPQDPGDRINYAEKALAGPVSKSAFQHLVGLDPPLVPAGPDIRVVKRIATIGAFMAAGVPLVPAARIANALSGEFDDGEPPSGLKAFAEHVLSAEELATLPAEPNDYWYHNLIVRREQDRLRKILADGRPTWVAQGVRVTSDDYWEHVERRRKQGSYFPGLVPAMGFDVRIEICDRRHVFMWPTSRLKSFWQEGPEERAFRAKHPRNPDHPEHPEPGFVGWIEDWERDTEMRFKHVSEVIQMNPQEEPHRSRIARLKAEHGEDKYREWYGDDDHAEQWRANAARLQVSAVQDVLPNATGMLTVNVSLAIRRALDRIAEHRASILRMREDAKKQKRETQK